MEGLGVAGNLQECSVLVDASECPWLEAFLAHAKKTCDISEETQVNFGFGCDPDTAHLVGFQILDVKMFVGTDIGTEEENLKLSMGISNADLSAWYWDGRNLHRWIAEIAREEILRQRKDENTTAIFVG